MASSTKPKIMNWTTVHDLVLCKEVIFVNPFSARKKSIQRSGMWQKIADNLNAVQDPHFIVEKRSVRDHIAILIQRFKRKQTQELRESGTTPERTDLDDAIEQIIAMEESADFQQQEINDENIEKVESDRRKAEDVRKKAMETMGKTQKRNSEEGNSKVKKSRKSGSGTLEYLKERSQQHLALREEELNLKKQESERLEKIQTQQMQMFKGMLEQQKQQQKQVQDMQSLLLLQQQTQSQAMMALLEKLVPK